MLVAPPQGIIASSHRTVASGKALFAWGANASGQLGTGNTTSTSSPVPVGAATNWTSTACGGCTLTNNATSLGVRGGALFAWGKNSLGQLGDGTTTARSSPVPIGAATNWSAIATSNTNFGAYQGASLGISGGALFAWGSNASGQLGNGSTASKSSPVPIGAATSWTAISVAGYNASSFSLGVSGGALFAWGFNGKGQLGDGTTASKSSPVPVGAATNWTAVSCGSYGSTVGFSIGIRGGAIFTWGYNAKGQLGDNTAASKSSPVPIGAATNWTGISASRTGGPNPFGLGISGGGMFAWGDNTAGQLGDGTTASESSPVPVGAATNWTAVSCGAPDSSLGVRGGALFAWGNNAYGQLGDNTTAAKSSPVPIGAATNWGASTMAGATGSALGLRG